MPDGFIVRGASTSDVATLVEFNRALARETEGRELDPHRLQAGVAGLLARPNAGFYLLAERDAQAVGGLLVTSEWSDWRSGYFWWIQSVYVRPDFRRQGVFRRLYQHVRWQARQRDDVCGLRLYVERENRAAQTTYRALGMRATAYEVYEEEFTGGAG